MEQNRIKESLKDLDGVKGGGSQAVNPSQPSPSQGEGKIIGQDDKGDFYCFVV